MITITNLGPYDDPDRGGKRTYEVGIRSEESYAKIATFEHYRNDGLAVCLQKAADAVAKARSFESTVARARGKS